MNILFITLLSGSAITSSTANWMLTEENPGETPEEADLLETQKQANFNQEARHPRGWPAKNPLASLKFQSSLTSAETRPISTPGYLPQSRQEVGLPRTPWQVWRPEQLNLSWSHPASRDQPRIQSRHQGSISFLKCIPCTPPDQSGATQTRGQAPRPVWIQTKTQKTTFN